MIRAGIIGGAGYTGGELIRLLLRHPHPTHLRCPAGLQGQGLGNRALGELDLQLEGLEQRRAGRLADPATAR